MLKNLKNRLNENKGFSLVELIVVIAIMVILIALLVPNVVGYISKAQDSANLSAAKSLYNAFNTAVIDYKAQNAGYPNAQQLADSITSVTDNAEKLVVIPKGTAVAVGYDGNGYVWGVVAATESGSNAVSVGSSGTSKNVQCYSPLASGNCYKTGTLTTADQPYVDDTDIGTMVSCISIKADGTWDTSHTNAPVPTHMGAPTPTT